jgi:hypothetical protein
LPAVNKRSRQAWGNAIRADAESDVLLKTRRPDQADDERRPLTANQ